MNLGLSNLTDYFNGMVDTINSQLMTKGINFPTIEVLDEDSLKAVKTPALLIHCNELPDSEVGNDGRMGESLSISIYCLLSNKTPNAKIEIINLASFVKRLVQGEGKRWGLGCNATNPEHIQAFESDFQKGMNGYKCWCVSFVQGVFMDESAIAETEYPVNEVWLGINPEDENDYKRIGSVDE